jgi:hypothetical protein
MIETDVKEKSLDQDDEDHIDIEKSDQTSFSVTNKKQVYKENALSTRYVFILVIDLGKI